MAKGVKTGGRKPGVPNKATAARVAEVAASGLTPLDFMLSVLRDEGRDYDTRIDAAKAAAPYVHPKLASIEHTGKDGVALIPTATEVVIVHHQPAAPEHVPTAGGTQPDDGKADAQLPPGPNPRLAVNGAVHPGSGGHPVG